MTQIVSSERASGRAGGPINLLTAIDCYQLAGAQVASCEVRAARGRDVIYFVCVCLLFGGARKWTQWAGLFALAAAARGSSLTAAGRPLATEGATVSRSRGAI